MSKDDALKIIEKAFWNDTRICPYCGGTRSSKFLLERRYKCNECHTSFSVLVGTLFHNTKADLEAWFDAIATILYIDPNISSRKLAEAVGVNKNTACQMLKKIKQALKENPDELKTIVKLAFD